MLHLSRHSYTRQPWKNGLGVTEEIYRHPGGADEFLFRVSMATLSTSGPFSLFPGIDRTLVLLAGASIRLNERELPLLTPIDFPGEAVIHATVTATGRDLNLMCRRGRAHGGMEVCRGSRTLQASGDYQLIFALTNDVTIQDQPLRTFDSLLLLPHEAACQVRGTAFIRLYIRH